VVNGSDTEPLPFLSPATLHWQAPHAPSFRCSVTNLAALDLPEDTYRLKVGERVIGSLVRQPDGTFAGVGFEDVPLGSMSPDISAHLLQDNGVPAQSSILRLWEPGEDVTVFRLATGTRVKDPWNDRLHTAQPYAILLAQDLRPEPRPAVWHALGDDWRIWLLPQHWSPDLKVFLGADVLWAPVLNEAREPAWAQGVQASAGNGGTVPVGSPLRLELRHPSDVEIRFVRGGTVPLDLARTGPGTTSAGPMPWDSSLAAEKMSVRIGARRGAESCTVYRSIPIFPLGVVKLGADGWEAVSAYASLSVEEAQEGSFRMFPPPAVVWPRDLALLEGDAWVGRVRPRPCPLGALSGWGARLVVRRGPYNAVEDVLEVSREVFSRGIIEDVDFWSDSTRIRVQVRAPIEPAPGHVLVWWAEDGEIACTEVKLEGACGGGAWWSADGPGQDPPLVAVALAYRGERIGAWWVASWADSLREASEEDAPFLAGMMRWFHLPVLAAQARRHVRDFAQRFPADVLAAWLLDQPPADGLTMPGLDEGWLSAVRALYRDWRPAVEEAHAVLLTLAGAAELDGEAVCAAGRRLHRSDPLLLCRILKSWFAGYWVPAHGNATATTIVAALLLCLGELPSLQQLELEADRLRASVAETLAVHPNFVDQGLVNRARRHLSGQPLELHDRFNLGLTLGVEPFRRLLALRLLPLTLP
jgi:hypothetical protein